MSQRERVLQSREGGGAEWIEWRNKRGIKIKETLFLYRRRYLCTQMHGDDDVLIAYIQLKVYCHIYRCIHAYIRTLIVYTFLKLYIPVSTNLYNLPLLSIISSSCKLWLLSLDFRKVRLSLYLSVLLSMCFFLCIYVMLIAITRNRAVGRRGGEKRGVELILFCFCF